LGGLAASIAQGFRTTRQAPHRNAALLQ